MLMETDQYLDVFLDESREHLQAINDNILELEQQPNNLDIVHEIFRSAHTLKGMAATMGFEDIASLTHKMENVLDLIRNQKLNVTSELIDIIFVAIEYLEEMVASISEGNDGKKDVSELVRRLEAVEKGEAAPQPAATEAAAAVAEEKDFDIELDEFQLEVIQQAKEQGFGAYQVSVGLTEDCILKGARAYMVFEVLEKYGEIIKTTPEVEEIEEGNFDQNFSFVYLSKENIDKIKGAIFKISEIEKVDIIAFAAKAPSAKPKEETPEQPAAKLEKPTQKGKKNAVKSELKSAASKTIRVNLERIDDLLNIFEEVIIDRGRLEVIAEGLGNQDLTETVEHLGRVSSEMQSLILSMRMVPIEQVFNRFPRMVRGLARDLGKKINLEIIGAETELDRTVIDEIGDPLVHLIRNSVDHGIEMPE
ncbi:MAG TPA: Hpt domain-containing protein, partial [Bacillota bacterium]|nr:Hpt domain-containing protein [Bacillota bacterium]